MSTPSFIQYFPLIEPPFTITEESAIEFSKQNKPIPIELQVENFSKWELDYVQSDETEYIPCCRLSTSEEFWTLIYWRAKPLQYEYFLITVDKKGNMIDRRLIAGLMSDAEKLVRMVASIDINGIIFITGGLEGANELDTNSLEIMPDGKFINS